MQLDSSDYDSLESDCLIYFVTPSGGLKIFMNKKQAVSVIVLSVILTLFINIFFGRFLSAKISTWPLLNRWKIISPQAPIVINNREEVRVNDTQDLQKIISQTRARISAIVTVGNNQAVLLGGAVNLTSDGLFLTAKSVVAGVKPDSLSVKLDDGTMAKIYAVVPDPASNLVLIKASINNAPTATLGVSKNLGVGERIIFLSPTLKNFSPDFQGSFVSQSQLNNYGATLDSDVPNFTFGAQSTGPLLAGQTVVNVSGEIVGLWDGNNIVSSDVIKDLAENYLSGSKFLRPAFGFNFQNIPPVEAAMLNVSLGARVKKVESSGVALKAGLKADDIITAINGTALTEDSPLEYFLQKFKPGDKVKFTVARGNNKIDLNLAAGELK